MRKGKEDLLFLERKRSKKNFNDFGAVLIPGLCSNEKFEFEAGLDCFAKTRNDDVIKTKNINESFFACFFSKKEVLPSCLNEPNL